MLKDKGIQTIIQNYNISILKYHTKNVLKHLKPAKYKPKFHLLCAKNTQKRRAQPNFAEPPEEKKFVNYINNRKLNNKTIK